MSQSLLNISTITKESLRILKNQLSFSKGVNRQYDSQFAKSGAKIGSVCNIRKPARFTVTSGAAMNLQNVEDDYSALSLDTQNHVAFQFSSKDLTLSIDEFATRYLNPAVAALANKIDLDGLALYKKVWNSVGLPGTTPSTLATILSAGVKLDNNGCPMDGERNLIVNPAAQASFVNALTGILNPASLIGKQYEKGVMGVAAGFNWKMDQNVNVHTTGALGGAPKVTTTIAAEGATSVVTDTWTSAGATRLLEGDIFTIADVYAVNPMTKQSTGELMQFVCTADGVESSGSMTIAFSPAIYKTSAKQNVNRYPTDEDLILIYGHASTYANKSSPVNLAYHKDAFVLGMADLELPQGVDMAARASDPDAGLSIRIVKAYDISNDTFPCRLDVLYGWKAVYPELACRIHG